MKRLAMIFWFTGLSGSGKTTIALGTKAKLEAQGLKVRIIDGDDVRDTLHKHLGFTREDIVENNRLIANICWECRSMFDVIIVPIISPFSVSRKDARRELGDGFYEIYFNASLECVVKRDIKGLYAKAERDEIKDMIGYKNGVPYESPENPDFIIDSGKDAVNSSTESLYNFILSKLGRVER